MDNRVRSRRQMKRCFSTRSTYLNLAVHVLGSNAVNGPETSNDELPPGFTCRTQSGNYG